MPPDGEPTLIRSRTALEFLAKIYFNSRNAFLADRAIKRVQLLWAGLAQDEVMPPFTQAEQGLRTALDKREPLIQVIYKFMTIHSRKSGSLVYEGLTSDLAQQLRKVADSLGYRTSKLQWYSNAISLGKALRRIETPLFQMGLHLLFGHTKLGTQVRLEWHEDFDPRTTLDDPLSASGNNSAIPSPQSSPAPVTPKPLSTKI